MEKATATELGRWTSLLVDGSHDDGDRLVFLKRAGKEFVMSGTSNICPVVHLCFFIRSQPGLLHTRPLHSQSAHREAMVRRAKMMYGEIQRRASVPGAFR